MRTNKVAEKRAQAKQINYWKWAFAILLALVIATVLFIGHKLTTPSVDQTRISQQTKKVDKNVDLDVSMNKQQLSAMINYYLRKSQKKSKIKYRFILDKSASSVFPPAIFIASIILEPSGRVTTPGLFTSPIT